MVQWFAFQKMKKILLITHHEFGDPGIISKILHRDYLLSTIYFYNLRNLSLKEINEFSAIIIFGGKMSSNSKSNNMKFEYNFLSKLIKLDKTIIGICLGAQIIAKFFGSKIYPRSSFSTPSRSKNIAGFSIFMSIFHE